MVSRRKYTEGNRTTEKMVCRICLKDHPLRFCKRFLKEDYRERMRLVMCYKYCAGCLSHDHVWRTCVSTGRCRRCGDLHHTLLHKPRARPSSSWRSNRNRHSSSKACGKKGPSSSQVKASGPSSSQGNTNGPSSSNGRRESERPSSSRALVPTGSRSLKTPTTLAKRQHCHDVSSTPVYQVSETILLKPTAIIRIVGKERYILERALIDPSAECSIVGEDVVRRLNARTVRVGRDERCMLQLRGNFGNSTTVETFAKIRRNYGVVTPLKSINDRIVDEFPGLQLADPQFNVSARASITLGAEVYSKIIRNGVAGGSFGKPLAQFSIFGYLISGTCSN